LSPVLSGNARIICVKFSRNRDQRRSKWVPREKLLMYIF